jgi:PAS domain S-box-containing protein
MFYSRSGCADIGNELIQRVILPSELKSQRKLVSCSSQRKDWLCRTLLCTTGDARAVLICDRGLLPDGSVEFQNRPWLEYSGLSAEEGRDRGWRKTLHPEDVEQFLNKWLEIRESQAPGEMEARFRHSDGEYRWFLARAVPMRDESGTCMTASPLALP